MSLFATAGSKLYIGIAKEQQAADFALADFSAANAATWKLVGQLEALGSLGDSAEAISFTAIDRNRTQTIKGPRSAGQMELVAGLDHADVGQLALIAAERTPHDYEFRLVLNDAPAGGGTPSERLFVAKVMTASEAFDAANSVMKANFTLGVNSNVVRINADEA
ncbi:hypothetical protein [Agrobacterium tumefaciens]|uniref:Phage tail protein n=1 Tax=Agrobacterium tumefaciens TaxID=358 RepID=A0AB36EQH3_AGRTU|nr:hypothetical protein A6U91_07550 [Agrobacterium tumefaciens]